MTTFVPKVKKIMEQRLFDKLVLRQDKFHAIVKLCSEFILQSGFRVHHSSISTYSASYINRQSIEEFIAARWKGPWMQQPITYDKCKYLGENWIDQHCFEITGRYFYALHIAASKSHLTAYCNAIIDISDAEKQIVLRRVLSYFVDKVLRAKVVYHTENKQPTSKPLIPYKTLRNSDDILKALGKLHSDMDLTNIEKRKRIDSKVFYDDLLTIADQLTTKYLKDFHQRMKQRNNNNHNNGMMYTADDEVLQWVQQSIHFLNKMSTQTLSTKNVKMINMVSAVFTSHNNLSTTYHCFPSLSTSSHIGPNFSGTHREREQTQQIQSQLQKMSPSSLMVGFNACTPQCNGLFDDPLQRHKKRKSHMNDRDKSETEPIMESINSYKKRKLNDNRPFSVSNGDAVHTNSNNAIHKSSLIAVDDFFT